MHGNFLKLHQVSRLQQALNPLTPQSDVAKLVGVLKILKSLSDEKGYTHVFGVDPVTAPQPGAAPQHDDEQKDSGNIAANAPSIPLSQQIGGCLHI